MPNYTDTEERNLDVVRQMFGEVDGPTDRAELFADDGVWWNGLPLIPGAVGQTEHRGKDGIRNLLPASREGKGLPPGMDVYDMTTAKADDVVMLADGDYVVRQQTFSAKTVKGKDYRNVYCFVFRFAPDGKIQYLTEHWNTWHAYRMLFNNFDPEPAHPES